MIGENGFCGEKTLAKPPKERKEREERKDQEENQEEKEEEEVKERKERKVFEDSVNSDVLQPRLPLVEAEHS